MSGAFTVPGEPPLDVAASTFFHVQDKYTAWEDREEWEQEALTKLEEADARREPDTPSRLLAFGDEHRKEALSSH